MTKAEANAWGTLIVFGVVVGLPLYIIMKFGETIGWHWFLTLIVVATVGFIAYQAHRAKRRREESEAQQAELDAQAQAQRAEIETQRRARRAALMAKYPEAIVDRLIRGEYWQGQPAAQLIDSLGQPEDIDQKLLKTKKREVWKYFHQSGNRYGLRLTLENDIVVGWDEKM